MTSFYKNIKDLSEIPTLSKHEQIVQGVISSIENNDLIIGDKLPSINEMVDEIGFARKTIVKAYNELKERGLIESKKLKGYFVLSQNTNVTLKVALVLYAFHSFQEDFYNTFRKELGDRFHIDIFFHHNNIDLFETIITNITDKYGMYVIAPIQSEKVKNTLLNISPEKLLLVDRFLSMPKAYSYVAQEFEEVTYKQLVKLVDKIKTYENFVLFYNDRTDFPPEILVAFNKFLKDYSISGYVLNAYEPGSIHKNTAYFFISDSQLWKVLKDIRTLEYRLGKDIGIIAHDDNIVKEITFGGITTISTDFKDMAQKAAKYVKNHKITKQIIPTTLKERNSL